ncbi:hypothetical protein Q1695_012529 [Nippostrongylus brasiliensis]|nr:hypothetical protein Q1695_012529 [Nippostrongylus brasiliensis]
MYVISQNVHDAHRFRLPPPFNFVIDLITRETTNEKMVGVDGVFVTPFQRLEPVNYTLAPTLKCDALEFILLVHINAHDNNTRYAWRTTYGQSSLRAKFHYNVLFSIGLPRSAKVQEGIVKESAQNRDIIQGNFIDSYRNLTLKHVAGLRAILAESCRDRVVVVKVDDDVVLNLRNISEFVRRNFTGQEDFLYCSKREKHAPMREKGKKWTVTKEEWSSELYPTHCLGMIYLVQVSSLRKMINSVPSKQFFWIDDVFVTGVLTEAANVTVMPINSMVSGQHHLPKEELKQPEAFQTNRDLNKYWFYAINHKLL